MDLTFDDLMVIYRSLVVISDKLVPDYRLSDSCDSPYSRDEVEREFDKLSALVKVSSEILKHRPLPF